MMQLDRSPTREVYDTCAAKTDSSTAITFHRLHRSTPLRGRPVGYGVHRVSDATARVRAVAWRHNTVSKAVSRLNGC